MELTEGRLIKKRSENVAQEHFDYNLKPEVLDMKQIKKKIGQTLPPAAIPVAAPRASKRPTTKNGVFGTDNISSVTMPARYRIYRIEKYTITYLKERKYHYSYINSFKHYNLLKGEEKSFAARMRFMPLIRVKN